MQFISYITRIDPETGMPKPHEDKRKVFISYKHADEEALPLCRRLADYILDKLDVAVWYDCQLTAGEEYDKEITSAIEASDAFVLLLTPTVLSSRYIIEREIPLAKKCQIAVIPVIAGIAECELPNVEAIVGRVHMPHWFFDPRDSVPAFSDEPYKQFIGGLSLGIANKDLLSQAELFSERGGGALSLRHLTPEQAFIKAYGCLFGVSSLGDKSYGVKLMESILASYGADEDFEALQKQVALELLQYFYRSDQPELFCTYAKLALAKGLEKSFEGLKSGIYSILFKVYAEQWYPEILCHESELSFHVFKACYYDLYRKEWGGVTKLLASCEPKPLDCYPAVTEENKIGEIVFDTHTAYLQKSAQDKSMAELVIDGRQIALFDARYILADVNMVYLAFDKENRLLLVLNEDMDLREGEIYTDCYAYRLDDDGLRSVYDGRGILCERYHFLPYTPHTFKIEYDHKTDSWK